MAYLNLCAVFLYTGCILFLKRGIFALLNVDENEIIWKMVLIDMALPETRFGRKKQGRYAN